MVHTKNNFKPLRCTPTSSGKSANGDLLDASVALASYSEKIAVSTVAAMDDSNVQTPYMVDGMPDSVRDDIEK